MNNALFFPVDFMGHRTQCNISWQLQTRPFFAVSTKTIKLQIKDPYKYVTKGAELTKHKRL